MSSDHDLNSLSRFRKQSGQLVLEEHGHCEVPAGCGGVVLRWRNPFAAVPLTLHLYTAAKGTCFLDGVEVQTARVDLSPGPHVVAVTLTDANRTAGLLLFAGVHHGEHTERGSPYNFAEVPVKVVTADDGTWKCSLDQPSADDWMQTGFDDRDWIVLTQTATPQLASDAPGAYQCEQCVDQGAVCLGVPARTPAARTGTVWIRKEFTIPLPQLRKQGSP